MSSVHNGNPLDLILPVGIKSLTESPTDNLVSISLKDLA
jgi:hypothetical protein